MKMVGRAALVALVAALVLPGAALAGVKVGQPFPANLYTVPDSSQVTGLRVDLPKPDRATTAERLRRRHRPQHARRVQCPAADLGPVLRRRSTSRLRRATTIFLVGPGGHVVGINQRRVGAC